MKKFILICFLIFGLSSSVSAISLIGSGIVAAGYTINDDFSSDTAANYTEILNDIVVAGGVANGTNNYADNIVYHSTSLGSDNHWVEADVMYDGNRSSGVILRCDGANGYYAWIQADGFYLREFGDDTDFVDNDATGTWSEDTYYTVNCTVDGSANFVCTATDDLSSVITLSGQGNDTPYTGTYVGLHLRRNGTGNYPSADNLKGNAN